MCIGAGFHLNAIKIWVFKFMICTLQTKMGSNNPKNLGNKLGRLVETPNLFNWVYLTQFMYPKPEVGIPQFEAQSASCATSARAEVAKRFNKLFLAIAQVALRFKENKSFLRFIALRTEKNIIVCALLRCELKRIWLLALCCVAHCQKLKYCVALCRIN